MANFLGKFKNMIYGEEYDDYDEFDASDAEYEEPLRNEEPPKRINSAPASGFDPYSPVRRQPLTKLVNINTKMEVVISSPSTLEEAGAVCEDLKAKKTTVVNLENVEYEMSQRITDFLCGACYALEGSIQLISDRIFIIGPVNVDITGEFKDELRASGIKFPTSMWK